MTFSPVVVAAPEGARITASESSALDAVLSAVRRGARVSIAGAWPTLRSALADAACEVTEIPLDVATAVSELSRIRPEALVFSPASTPALLGPLLDKASDLAWIGQVIVVFRNVSSSLVVDMLGGCASQGEAVAERWVRERLAAAGLTVAQRRAWNAGHSGEPRLAMDAERSLRRLLTQLEPSADADQVALVATRSAQPQRKTDLVPGLVSVVVRNHSTSRLPLLDQALFSLAGQRHRPLEIVLVTQAAEDDARERLEGALRRHQAYAGFEYQIVQHLATTDARARLANLGIEHARGQYVAFLDDDDVVYPDHYERLVKALRKRKAAWAFASVRRAWFTKDPEGNLYCRKKDVFPSSDRWDLLALLRENYIACHSYLIDRTRIGGFRIAFAEELTKNEDYVLLLRLAALFRPVAVGGQPTCEYRIRDDGTNSIMAAARSDEEAQQLHAEWSLANALKDGLRNPLQMLITEGEFVRMAAGVPDSSEPARALRHWLVDRGNDLLKGNAPRLHRTLKKIALGVGRRLRTPPDAPP